MTKGTGTRSGLLWEVERILDECTELPQILLMENVPQVVGTRNIEDFQLWRAKLEQLGYSNYVELLNAKDFGIPQNRLRCFMISILGEYSYTFPHKQELHLKLKDMLEDKVDEKYYLSEKALRYVTKQERMDKKFTEINGDIAIPVTAKGQQNCQSSFVADGLVEREREESRPRSEQAEGDLLTDTRGTSLLITLNQKEMGGGR